MKKIPFLLFLTLLTACNTPVRVILDTDIDSDVDDVQALAMLHAYERKGLIDLIGVVVTSNDTFAPTCVDAINTFYDRPDIPIGYLREQDDLGHFSKYTKEVSEAFPHDLQRIEQTTESALLYRQLLADSPDQSVVLISIGHLSSLQALLQSPPDRISTLSGQALARKKVKRWLCMGGQFPEGKEANFYRPDPQSTLYCLEHWKQEVVFAGWEVGSQIKTGGPYLRDHLPSDHPVYQAYERYNHFAGRSAWDQVAVMLLDPIWTTFFELTREGYVQVAPDGSNSWQAGTSRIDRKHAYVQLRPAIDPDLIAQYLDELVILMEKKEKE